METTVLYWNAKQKLANGNQNVSCGSISESSGDEDSGVDVPDMSVTDAPVNGNIVWAGLEPPEFKAIFPEWVDRDDIAQINIQVIYTHFYRPKTKYHKTVSILLLI